jgi:hypothetical protein
MNRPDTGADLPACPMTPVELAFFRGLLAQVESGELDPDTLVVGRGFPRAVHDWVKRLRQEKRAGLYPVGLEQGVKR